MIASPTVIFGSAVIGMLMCSVAAQTSLPASIEDEALEAFTHMFSKKLWERSHCDPKKQQKYCTIWLSGAAHVEPSDETKSKIRLIPGLLVWDLKNLKLKLVGEKVLTKNQAKHKAHNAHKTGVLEVLVDVRIHLICELAGDSYNCNMDQGGVQKTEYTLKTHGNLEEEYVDKSELDVIINVMMADLQERAKNAITTPALKLKIEQALKSTTPSGTSSSSKSVYNFVLEKAGWL